MFKKILKNRIPFITFFVILAGLLLVRYFDTSGKFHVLEYLLYLLILFAGTWSTRKTLQLFLPEPVTSFTLIILVFCTNLTYIAGVGQLFQPVILFSLYSLVIYLAVSSFRSPRLYKTILLALFSGLTLLAQGTGYLVLLIPLFWGMHDRTSAKEKFTRMVKNYRNSLVFIFVILLVVIVPVVILKISPGNISFLDFKLPGLFILNFRYLWIDLFSFNHGWLIYSPVILLSIAGFYFLAERNREIYYAVFILTFLGILFGSCWTELGSTDVFGQIAFVQLLAVLSLPLGYLLKVISEKGRIAITLTAVFCSLFLLLNLFQTWQYNNGIILKSGMTADAYCRVFGRTNVSDLEKVLMAGIDPDPSLVLKDTAKFTRKTLAFYDFSREPVNSGSKPGPICEVFGRRVYKMDSTVQFSPALKEKYSDLSKKRQVGARLTVSVYVQETSSLKGGFLVITSVHEGTSYRYRELRLWEQNLKPGQWQTVSIDYLSPIDPYPGDVLDFHVWYTGKESLYIDDLKFELFEPKE
ncbi:MAG: hypothetical protein NTU98_09475 [Bacteroidetes bacterium]|nr:hypothetical protein [Bacteroidota bacterium]